MNGLGCPQCGGTCHQLNGEETQKDLISVGEHFVRNYGVKIVLVGAGVYLASVIAKAAVSGYIQKKVSAKK